jgi:hypothetical protein
VKAVSAIFFRAAVLWKNSREIIWTGDYTEYAKAVKAIRRFWSSNRKNAGRGQVDLWFVSRPGKRIRYTRKYKIVLAREDGKR